MISAVKQLNGFKPDIGDIIYGSEWISGYLTKELWNNHKPVYIPNFGFYGHSSWYILERKFKLDNVNELKNDFKYQDPWYDNTFWYWYPEWLLIKNLDFYISYINPNTTVDDMFWDYEYWKDRIKTNAEKHSLIDIGGLTRTFIGHGYNQYTMPNDGSGRIREFVVELQNGDFIFGHGWEWYNK